MDANLEALARELTALTQRFADLGAKLGDAARALEEAGAPPNDVLVTDLAGARSKFIELRADVLNAAEAASVPPKGEPESLTELEPLLGAIATALRLQAKTAEFQQIRQEVVATLDRVLEIVHRDDRAFPTLVGCHDQARVLREQAMALSDPEAPEARKLAANAQAFGDLLSMVENRDAMDDERYAQLEEAVSRTFGRPLAVAVARGRLAFADEIVEPAPEPEPAAEPEPEPAHEPVLAAPAPVPHVSFRDALPSLAPPPVDEPPLELAIEPPPAPPEPATLALESAPPPVVELPDEVPALTMPTVEMPPIEMPRLEPIAPPPAPEPRAPEPPEPEPAPPVAVPPEPVVAEAAPARPGPVAEPSAPDETAQWWLAAWARWSGWKSTHDFASVVREELGKYPYLLSVPIQKSPEYDDGLLAYGYSILMDHVEKQNPGCVGNALNSLKAGVSRPVGEQLYEYLVSEGHLGETYPEFVKNTLLAAVPEPGVWFQFRILESKEDTRIFQRPTARLGDAELSGQRLANDNQRYAEHKFKMTLPPLTMRCVQVSAESIRDARGVGVKLASDGAASESGWIATVPAGSKGKTETRRIVEEGTHVPGLGKEFAAVWIAVFNPDPTEDRRYDLSVFLRKDTKSPFRGR